MSTIGPQIERDQREPFIRQFSVFLPNRVGQFGELLGTLAEAGVEVLGVSIVDSSDWAVVRAVFSDPDKARDALNRHGMAFTECDALGVVLADAASLQKVCTALLAAELNVKFAFPLLVQREGQPVMVLHVDDEVLAVRVLARHGFHMIGHEEP